MFVLDKASGPVLDLGFLLLLADVVHNFWFLFRMGISRHGELMLLSIDLMLRVVHEFVLCKGAQLPHVVSEILVSVRGSHHVHVNWFFALVVQTKKKSAEFFLH